MMVDTIAYVTKVEQDLQADPPEEDRVGDPISPTITGGKVIVTAECAEGFIHFAVPVDERITVGDSVHLRVDFARTDGRD